MEASDRTGRTSGAARAEALARTREMIRIQRRGRRDRWPPVVLGSSFVVVTLLALTQLESFSVEQLLAVCLLLPAYVLAQRLGLEDDDGSFVMTQSVFVAMLLLIPLAAVPAVVLVGAIAAERRDPSPYHPFYKLCHIAMNGWFCIGPVLVLAVAHEGPPSFDQWPVYVAALLAQFVFDGAVGFICCLVSRGNLQAHTRSVLWIDAMDVMLAAIGLTAVIATNGSLWAIAFASAPIGMLILVTRDRRAQVARAVAVTDAFDEVVEQSLVDPLTSLANRRRWNEAIDVAEARRRVDSDLVVTAVVADVDGLKCVNDSLGHQAGDELLRDAADLIRESAPDGARGRPDRGRRVRDACRPPRG